MKKYSSLLLIFFLTALSLSACNALIEKQQNISQTKETPPAAKMIMPQSLAVETSTATKKITAQALVVETSTAVKKITAQAFAVCIFAAAQTYVVPPSVLIGILNVEGGRIGQAIRNPNNTYSLGPMHINTIWIPELASYWGISEKEAMHRVRDDVCVNISVGAWILRKKINQTGSLSEGVAYYYSATPQLGHNYRKKVIEVMRKYRLMRTSDKLVASLRADREDSEKIPNEVMKKYQFTRHQDKLVTLIRSNSKNLEKISNIEDPKKLNSNEKKYIEGLLDAILPKIK